MGTSSTYWNFQSLVFVQRLILHYCLLNQHATTLPTLRYLTLLYFTLITTLLYCFCIKLVGNDLHRPEVSPAVAGKKGMRSHVLKEFGPGMPSIWHFNFLLLITSISIHLLFAPPFSLYCNFILIFHQAIFQFPFILTPCSLWQP